MSHKLNRPPEKFGTLLGYAPGRVPIYSSHYPSVDSSEYPDRRSYQHVLDGVYMGYKWQCVEFARRWLYCNYGYVFDDVAMAYDIFELRQVLRLRDQAVLPLRAFRNGSQRPPEAGCMLIWQEGGEFDVTGHVAIVTEVLAGSLRFAEQNVEHARLPEGQSWSRELPLSRTAEQGFFIDAAYPDTAVLGWVIQTADAAYAEPQTPRDPTLLRIDSRMATIAQQHAAPWLNVDDAAERAYVTASNGHRLNTGPDRQEDYRYFRISGTAQTLLARATDELHLMFLHATQAVLQDDALLARFNIPAALWPRLRTSWQNRRSHTITGRFDFALSEAGLKVYEYNADSASCHMETGRVQGKWAKQFDVDEGEDAGHELSAALISAWQLSDAGELMHIMQDQDAEETYHALYVQSAAEAAGIRCKLLKGLAGVRWNAEGHIVDADGERVRAVWKTWAWETALDQIRAECEDDDAVAHLEQAPARLAKPRLVDVLLSPQILVFEPLWTLIPSNKAILPILWQIFPNHPFLLETQFALTDRLKEKGYVSKPIAGRCGLNIALIDKHENVLNETAGRFGEQDSVFQALWRLPEVARYRVQICTFTARGKYAGSCARVDKSLIITTGSDLMPLRVVDDETL